MKDKTIKSLYSLAKKMEEYLRSHINETREQQDVTLQFIWSVENLYKGFTQLVPNEEAEKNPLSKENAQELLTLYNDTLNKFNDYVTQASIYANEDFLNEHEDNLEYLTHATEFLKGQLVEGAEPLSMYDNATDASHLKGIFNEDPNAEGYKKKGELTWKAEEHTLKENLDKYKSGLDTLYTGFVQHLNSITGVTKSQLGTLNKKLEMIQDALNKEFEPEECTIDIKSLYYGHTEILDVVDKKQISALDKYNTINEHYYNKILGEIIDTDKIGVAISQAALNGHINPRNVSVYMQELNKLKSTQYNMGFDNETLLNLNGISTFMLGPRRTVEQLMTHIPAKDQNSFEFKHILKKADAVTQQMLDYITERSNQEPKLEDFEAFFDGLKEYSKTVPPIVFNEQGLPIKNPIATDCYTACESLAHYMPLAFRTRFEQYKEEFNNRYIDVEKELLNTIATDPFTPAVVNGVQATNVDKAYNTLQEMSKMGIVPKEMLDRAYFVRMCRDSVFRDTEAQKAYETLKNPAQEHDLEAFKNTFIAARLIEHEYSNIQEYLDIELPEKECYLKYSFNTTIAKAMDQNKPLTDADIDNLYHVFDGFVNGPQGAALKAKTTEKLLELENLPAKNDASKIFYGNPDNFIANLNEDLRAALIQESGHTYNNSPEYNAIYDSLKQIADAGHKPGGPADADYMRLFEASTNYLASHDTKLKGQNAQLRVSAARAITIQVAEKLYDDAPELSGKLEKQMQINMLRSKEFRDHVMDMASETITKMSYSTGIVDGLKFREMNETQRAKLSNAMKLYAFGLKAEELLKNNKMTERIKGDIKDPRKANALLEKFKDARDYANKAVDEKFKEIMLTHGKKVEAGSPNLQRIKAKNAETKEVLYEHLNNLKESFKEQLTQDYANKNDAGVLESVAALSYLKLVEENKELLSADNLKKALGPETIMNDIEKIKPAAAMVLNRIPSQKYESFTSPEMIAEFAEPEIKKLLKNPDNSLQKAYNDNLAKNNGQFKRDNFKPAAVVQQ